MKIWLWVVRVSLSLTLVLGWMPIALASVHHYPEGDDRVMYRSLQTLRDRQDHAWQLVLFKRVAAGRTERLHLRLVGFPGVTEFAHPHSINIRLSTDRQWQAADVTAHITANAPIAANVAEYDVQAVMADLDADVPLRLSVPLQPEPVELVVPPFVVQEWRQVANRSS